MINVLSFRLSLWYSSGVFVLIVVILILIYIILFDGVSSLIIALFSFGMTLLVSYNNNSNGYDYNDLLIALNIKSGAYDLGSYNPGTYGLPI